MSMLVRFYNNVGLHPSGSFGHRHCENCHYYWKNKYSFSYMLRQCWNYSYTFAPANLNLNWTHCEVQVLQHTCTTSRPYTCISQRKSHCSRGPLVLMHTNDNVCNFTTVNGILPQHTVNIQFPFKFLIMHTHKSYQISKDVLVLVEVQQAFILIYKVSLKQPAKHVHYIIIKFPAKSFK